MLALTHSAASKNKRCDLLLRLANMYPEGSAKRKLKIDEVEKVMEDISLLETKMETYSQTAKRPRLSAVDSLLDAMMNTAPSCHTGASASSLWTISTSRTIDNNTGLAVANAGLAATIESGPCHFQGCECTSDHVCQGSCGFCVCITCCDEKLGLKPGAYYCNDCFKGVPTDERVRLRHGLHRVDGAAKA
jgi:hypothetical protein